MKFRETMIVSGGLLTQQVAVFLTGIVIARTLGAVGYGELATLKSFSTFLLILTPLGLDLALLKQKSLFKRRPAEFYATTTMLRTIVFVVNLFVLLLVVVWLGPWLQTIYPTIPHLTTLSVITVTGLVFAADIQVSGALYRVTDQIVEYSFIVNYAQPILRLGLSLLVLGLGGSVRAIVLVNAAMFAATFLFMLVSAFRSSGHAALVESFKVDARRNSKGVLKDSLWMALLLLVYQAMRFIDVMMLAAYTTSQVTGDYSALSNVAQLIQIYPSALSQTLGPAIAEHHADGDFGAIARELRSYLRKASLIGGYILGGVAAFGADLDLVFGKAFHFSWQLAALLGGGWYISAVLAPFGYVLSMTGRHREELGILALGLIVLLIALRLAIPPFGSTGAALAVSVAFFVVNVVRSFYVVRVMGLSPLRSSDVYTPLCFVCAALACHLVGGALGHRSFIFLLAECGLYSVVAFLLYLGLFATGSERATMALSVRHATVR